MHHPIRKLALLLLIACCSATSGLAQITLWTEDFESDGNGSRYTSSNEFYDGTSDHFQRTNGSNINNISGPYSNFHGSFFFAGEDLDDNGGDGNPQKTIDFDPINISGYTNLRFSGLFGAGSAGGCTSSDYDNIDYIIVRYGIDAPAGTKGLEFRWDNCAGDVFNEPLRLDTDFNGVGDATQLVTALQEFTFSIAGTGSMLNISIDVYMNSGDEEIAFDFFRVEGDPDCPADLFISEYGEGSGSNKYIEIYNGTGAAVNLANYRVERFANGSATPTGGANLSGTLNNGDVYIICNSSASGTILGAADLQSNAIANWNGDDAILLYNTATGDTLDVFGNIGCDPGAEWNNAGTETQDRTLVRNGAVVVGVNSDPGNAGCNFPTLNAEWIELPQNNWSDLGSHVITAPGCTGPEMAVFGNSLEIADGDVTPTTADHTDFGSAAVGITTVTRTFTIENTGGGGLTLFGPPLVQITGPNAGDFSVTSFPTTPVGPGGSTTFQVTFSPSALGTRTANIIIANDDPDEDPYNFEIRGTGENPSLTITAPTGGSTFNSSYETTITWDEVGVTNNVTVEYAEDGSNFITIGTVPPGTGSFTWRPNFYHTTWDGTTFQPTGVIRLTAGPLNDNVNNITVAMVPCAIPTANQIIQIQDFDNAPANEWGYTQTSSADAVAGEVSAPAFGVASGSTPVNNTSGGSNAFLHADNGCSTGSSSQAQTVLNFNTINVASFTNIEVELIISSIQLVTSVCGGGVGNDTDDFLEIEVSLDGGPYQTMVRHNGFGNLTFPYGAGAPLTVTYPGFTAVSGGATRSEIRLELPNGTNTVDLRIRMVNNRQEENWAIDDVVITGDNVSSTLAFDRDCYFDVNSTIGTNNWPGDMEISVANSANEDTDILVDCSGLADLQLNVTGDLDFVPDAGNTGTIIHLPAEHRLRVEGTPGISGSGNVANSFVASAFHRLPAEGGTASQEGGLVQPVGGATEYFPVGSYIDNNSSATKIENTALLSNSTGTEDFVVRVQPTGLNAPNEPASGLEFFDQPAMRYSYAAHSLWFISPLTGSSYNTDITLRWNPGYTGGNFSCTNLTMGHWTDPGYSGTHWVENTLSALNCGGNLATASGFTTFSPFMLGSENIPFPVELLGLTGEFFGEDVLLNWSTASEQNNLGFEVQRSLDNRTFEPVEFVAGNGTTEGVSNYQLLDEEPGADHLYYRLKQVDYDGTFNFSNVVEVMRSPNAGFSLSMYPNPTTNFVQLNVQGAQDAELAVALYDLQGRKLLNVQGSLATVNAALRERFPQLSQGIYVLKANVNGESFSERIVKQ